MRRVESFAAELCALLLLASGRGGEARGQVVASGERLRESFEVRLGSQPLISIIEGDAQSLFELHVTNFTATPLTLDELSIRDDRGIDRLSVRASDIGSYIGHVRSIRASPGSEVAPGEHVAIYLQVPLGPRPSRRLLAELGYRTSQGERHSLAVPPIAVAFRKPIVVGPPVRGGPWVAVRDGRWARGHRRVLYTLGGKARLPGRYAIDWVKVDDNGRTATGDPDTVASAFGYGEPVLAVADGEVVAVRDDAEEVSRISLNTPSSLENGPGNFVVLRIAPDRYAIYEHLRPGSLRVSPGTRVVRGAELGQIGATGDTTGPHLHFHVADGPDPLMSEGVPFAFERFTLLGRVVDFGRFGSAPWQPLETGIAPGRSKEAPGMNAVVSFRTRDR